MRSEVQLWHYLVGGVLVAFLGFALWRTSFAPREPNIAAEIPKGQNADNALTIKMD